MVIRITSIVAALWLAAVPARADTAATIAAAAAQYRAGHVLDAQATLKAGLPRAKDAGERWTLVSSLTDICAYSYDHGCIAGNQKSLADAAAALNVPALTAPRIVFALAFQAYLEGNLDFFRQTAGLDFAAKIANPLADPALATRLFLLDAAVEQKAGDFAAAHRMIDRAFASFLRIDSGKDAFETAALLKELIAAALANHDTLRAVHWALAGDPVIRAGLSPASFDYADYLAVTAEIAETLSVTGDPAVNALERARSAAAALQIAPALKEGLVSNLSINQAALYGLRGDIARMRARLAANPFAARREQIIAGKVFSSLDEMFYAAAEIFFDSLAHKAPDPRWKPLFQNIPHWNPGMDFAAQGRIYAKVALALLGGTGDAPASQRVRDAARESVTRFERGLGDVQAFPLPSLLDRLTLTIAIGAMPPQPKAEDADLLLAGLELTGRTARYAISDTMAMLAAQDSDEKRHAAHALLRLSDRRAEWEVDQLKALAARMAAHQQFPAKDFTPQIAAQGFSDGVARMEKAITPPPSRLPSASSLQAALAPDEAFLGIAQGLRICVRPKGIWTSRIAFDARKVRLDVKLLSAALSAQNAASDRLDAQYPAAAAMRLYHLLFDDLGGCLDGARRLIYAPPGDLAAIPLAALLSREPPRLGDGYDLAQAHWLVLDYAVSTVTSVRDFLSSRTLSAALAKRPEASLNFAAIGDPKLDGPAAGAFQDMPALPETRTEVTRIAELFKTGTDLKLGASASEENFRSLPLDRYQVLHFATHGLLRDDIDGLSQAALVFTPEDPKNILDDGLLTASDVANLNLAARLVVLSACNTANLDPTIFTGQLQGLASAFAAAGAPTMIASLWAVNSQTGQRLMVRFYRALLNDAPDVASALQQAMIETLRDAPSPAFRNPRFWSPFIVLGDGGAKIANRKSQDRRESEVAVSAGGGEIMAMTKDGDGAVSSEIGPLRNGRASSLIRKRSAGAFAWSLEDQKIGAGALVSRDGVNYAAGYVWRGKSVPVLRAVSPDGKLLWRKEIASRFDNAVIASLIAGQDGLFAVIAPMNEDARKIDFDVLRFDPSGREKARTPVTTSGPAMRIAMGRTLFAAALMGSDLYVTAGHGATDMQPVRNDFGFASLCYRGSATQVYRIRAGDLSLAAEARIPGLQIQALLAGPESLSFAGAAREECAFNAERAAMGHLNPDLTASLLWRDEGAFYGHLVALAPASGGFVGVADISEPLDGAPASQSVPPDASAKYPAGMSGTSSEAVLIRFDAKGKLLGKTFLGNGLPQFAQGLTRTGADSYAVFGSDGFNPWLEHIN